MPTLSLRFDLRNPGISGTDMTERYRAALDMAEWADQRGFATVLLSEHHGSEDGYLPSSLTMAAAVAARTERVRIVIAALVGSFHDPLRLAEDAAVVDLISGGRLDLVIAGGYVRSEFDMFGADIRKRPSRTTETIETLRNAWSGKPFPYRGRSVQVTPAPANGGPSLAIGGGSLAAARRAVDLGVGFLAPDAPTWNLYREEAARQGKPDPGPYSGGGVAFFHLCEDPERGWQQIAPYALHESNSYGKWLSEAADAIGVYQVAADVDELRATGQYRVLTPAQLEGELRADPHRVLMFHPMMGGIPPELGWKSLRLFEQHVLPRLDKDAERPADTPC
ncbi:MAG TPA: LLM class flavin-dependent oxidoreductase [Mycobacteriales bacterium]|nr:LLM class flavin-dependent oxidoreductase [Mycobacteriales bacterium]